MAPVHVCGGQLGRSMQLQVRPVHCVETATAASITPSVQPGLWSVISVILVSGSYTCTMSYLCCWPDPGTSPALASLAVSPSPGAYRMGGQNRITTSSLGQERLCASQAAE